MSIRRLLDLAVVCVITLHASPTLAVQASLFIDGVRWEGEWDALEGALRAALAG